MKIKHNRYKPKFTVQGVPEVMKRDKIAAELAQIGTSDRLCGNMAKRIRGRRETG